VPGRHLYHIAAEEAGCNSEVGVGKNRMRDAIVIGPTPKVRLAWRLTGLILTHQANHYQASILSLLIQGFQPRGLGPAGASPESCADHEHRLPAEVMEPYRLAGLTEQLKLSGDLSHIVTGRDDVIATGVNGPTQAVGVVVTVEGVSARSDLILILMTIAIAVWVPGVGAKLLLFSVAQSIAIRINPSGRPIVIIIIAYWSVIIIVIAAGPTIVVIIVIIIG
tara:strand:- start:1774 stop:2439 length:666 start_codon:yes stop_codon:yes gene_type:complete